MRQAAVANAHLSSDSDSEPTSRATFPFRSYMMMCGAILLPVAFLKNLQHVSSLSFWNGIVHTVINAVILGYCLTQMGNWGFSKVCLLVQQTICVDMLTVVLVSKVFFFLTQSHP